MCFCRKIWSALQFTTIEEEGFTNSSIASITFLEGIIGLTSTPGLQSSDKRTSYIFEKDFKNDPLEITLKLDFSSSNLDNETRERFSLWDEEKNEVITTLIVEKTTKGHSVKAVYNDGDKILNINNEGEVRVIMNYLNSQRVEKDEDITLTLSIDSIFDVIVKKEGSVPTKEESITTTSTLAVLGENRDTIRFKENGQYILSVYNTEKEELTKDFVVVVNQGCAEADTKIVSGTNNITKYF